MLSPKIRQQIVEILESDFYLIENRMRFLNSLDLPEIDTVTISNLNLKEFFSSALNAWNSTSGSNATIYQLCEILKSKRFQSVAEKLETEFPNEFPTTSSLIRITYEAPPVSFEVSKEVRNFTGRSTVLKLFKESFRKNKEYIFTLTGMGGIGKSEVAKNVARLMHEEHNITIIWLNGQNRHTLQDSVERLALKFGSNTDTHKTVVKNTKEQFLVTISRIPTKKLIIIDNVDEANEGADSLIKAKTLEDDCVFLITSRNMQVLNFAGETVKLDIFPDEEAQRLVSTALETETQKDVKRLCDLLQNFPLALQQAVAYIKAQKHLSAEGESYSISKYIESFEASKIRELLGYELNLEHCYELTTLITWQMTMEKIHKYDQVGELAIKILNLVAYFQPDRIHMDLLHQFFKEGDDVEKAIQLIKTYSLVKSEERLISIHRLLQQVIQLNKSEQCQEVQHLREITKSILKILENGKEEIQIMQPKFFTGRKFPDFSKDFDSNPLWKSIRQGIGHLLSVWNQSCKHPELIPEIKNIPIKIINVIYPLRVKFPRLDEVTHFTIKCYSLFKFKFGQNARESLELESEVAFVSEPKMSLIKLKTLDEIYDRQSSILGEDNNILNLKLLEKISYSILCEECYSSNKIRYGKYLYDFLRLREKISGRGHESTFPVRWKLIKEHEGKDPEWVIKLNELLNDVPPRDKDHFLEKMERYGDSLFEEKKMVKAKEIYERWLGFKGTEETWKVTSAKCTLSFIQFILGDRESALQTLQQAAVEWENREKEPKLFVEMRSECERGDRKVKEGDLEDALRLYTRVTDYQNQKSPKNYPFSSIYDWWRMETDQKRASVLIKLRRCNEALHILQIKVRWVNFVDSNHKLEIEKNELLEEVEERVRLNWEASVRWMYPLLLKSTTGIH